MKNMLFAAVVCTAAIPTDIDATTPDKSLAVWWDRAYLSEIRSISDCANQWKAWRPISAHSKECLAVEMTMPNESKVGCATVAEWFAAIEKGGYAYSTYDITMESHFIERSIAYSAIPLLLPATRTGFKNDEWSTDVKQIIAVDDRCGDGKRLARRERVWEIEPHSGAYHDEEEWEHVRVLAKGDYDGDGWQDLVIAAGAGYTKGTLRYYTPQLVTRRGSDRIIDTSARLLDGQPSVAEIKRHRAALAESYGLPEGIPFVLRGTMKLLERTVTLEAELSFSDGFVTGWYRYSHIGTRIPLEGTMGSDQSIVLQEYALDELQPNAIFRLKWKRTGDSLSVTGHWTEFIESKDVELTGSLGKTKKPDAPKATPSRARS